MNAKKEIIKNETQLPAVYDYGEDVDMGLEDIAKYLRPQRVKVKQKQSGEDNFGEFNNGDLILMPERSLFMPCDKSTKKGEVFYFTPILFFPEFMRTNPIGADKFIDERTLDENTDLARKCRDPEWWKVPVDGQPDKFIRHSEVLNFLVIPHGDNEFAGTMICLSFARGGRRDGEKLLTLLERRRKRRIPMFANVFEANTAPRKNAEGDWYGIDFRNPSAESGVDHCIAPDSEDYAMYRELQVQLKKMQDDIVVDYEDDKEEAPTVDTSEM